MCGRYTLMTDADHEEILEIIREVQRRYPDKPVKKGEVYPTNWAPILRHTGGRLEADIAKWGFPNFRNKGVIINARAETAAEKPTFRQALESRRCVVPATGFFEWDKSKKKLQFYRDGAPIYMAGLYNEYDRETHYVILTTDANESVLDVHNRMPVVLEQTQHDGWITDTTAAYRILQSLPPLLEVKEAI